MLAPAFLGAGQAKPSADSLFHCGSVLSIETVKTTDQLDDRHCNEALSIEASGSEEPNGNGYLEARAAQTGGVGDERNERPVGVLNRHAEDECGAHLRSEAQIDKPDLAALR